MSLTDLERAWSSGTELTASIPILSLGIIQLFEVKYKWICILPFAVYFQLKKNLISIEEKRISNSTSSLKTHWCAI